ncbi:hypothetical protein [Pseudoluteimonas lycopersici]|nr:hypothetical protein [Lysobacter lycopersici]
MDKETILGHALAAGANPETTRWKIDPDGRETLLVSIPEDSMFGNAGCLAIMENDSLRNAVYISRERE